MDREPSHGPASFPPYYLIPNSLLAAFDILLVWNPSVGPVSSIKFQLGSSIAITIRGQHEAAGLFYPKVTATVLIIREQPHHTKPPMFADLIITAMVVITAATPTTHWEELHEARASTRITGPTERHLEVGAELQAGLGDLCFDSIMNVSCF